MSPRRGNKRRQRKNLRHVWIPAFRLAAAKLHGNIATRLRRLARLLKNDPHKDDCTLRDHSRR